MPFNFFSNYSEQLISVLSDFDWSSVSILAEEMDKCWNNGGSLYLCGNGGSAGNASHLANDFIYGIAKSKGEGLKSISLNDNLSVLTCLANDVGYDYVFSEQLAVLGKKDDLLIALSGSGNSMNIVNAILEAKSLKMKTHAILGFDGGKCKKIVENPIHFAVNDMQLSEDLQLVVGHMIMKWLFNTRKERKELN